MEEDDGHILPEEVWSRVVADAERDDESEGAAGRG